MQVTRNLWAVRDGEDLPVPRALRISAMLNKDACQHSKPRL